MINVSIVEDQPDVLRSLVRNIDRTEGLTCISHYTNGEDAATHLPTDRPDVVLMDIGLPKMNGVECMMKVQLQAPRMEFLMFTVFDHDEMVFEALKAGASGYVLKSDRVPGAIRAIQEWAAGGAPMSRDIAKKVLGSFRQKEQNRHPDFEALTERQLKILELLSTGKLNKEIADLLGISEGTVKQHNYAIFKKLHVNNRLEAVNKYLNRD